MFFRLFSARGENTIALAVCKLGLEEQDCPIRITHPETAVFS